MLQDNSSSQKLPDSILSGTCPDSAYQVRLKELQHYAIGVYTAMANYANNGVNFQLEEKDQLEPIFLNFRYEGLPYYIWFNFESKKAELHPDYDRDGIKKFFSAQTNFLRAEGFSIAEVGSNMRRVATRFLKLHSQFSQERTVAVGRKTAREFHEAASKRELSMVMHHFDQQEPQWIYSIDGVVVALKSYGAKLDLNVNNLSAAQVIAAIEAIRSVK